MIQNLSEYKELEKSIKKLHTALDSDILEINVYASKKAGTKGNLEIKINRRENIRTILS